MDALLTEGARQLLSYGLLGFLVLVLGWLLYKRDQSLTECEKARREEAIAYATKLAEMNALVVRSADNGTSALVERNRSTQEFAASQIAQAAAIEHMTEMQQAMLERVGERLGDVRSDIEKNTAAVLRSIQSLDRRSMP